MQTRCFIQDAFFQIQTAVLFVYPLVKDKEMPRITTRDPQKHTHMAHGPNSQLCRVKNGDKNGAYTRHVQRVQSIYTQPTSIRPLNRRESLAPLPSCLSPFAVATSTSTSTWIGAPKRGRMPAVTPPSLAYIAQAFIQHIHSHGYMK